jgi:hypothetical protein
MLSLRRQTLWIQDWPRGTRSVNIPSAEPIGLDGTVIVNTQTVTLEDADDFVLVTVDDCRSLTDSQELSYIDSPSIWYCPCCHDGTTDDDHESVSRKCARLLELSGRREHDHSFCDLRSASKAGKREKTTRQKYYNFRYVKPGDLGAPACQSVGDSDADHETLPKTLQTGMTKPELYRQAQLPPRPPKYHRRHIDKIRGTLSHRVDIRRENRKHGKAILRDHLQDFDDGESVYRLIHDLQDSLALE